MNEKDNKIVWAVILIFLVLVFFAVIVFIGINLPKWEKGKYADEFLVEGLEKANIDYDECQLETIINEENGAYTFVYQIIDYEVIDTEDIDNIMGIYHMKVTNYKAYITLEPSDCFWNKLRRMLSQNNKKIEKYETCLDFDIAYFINEKGTEE